MNVLYDSPSPPFLEFGFISPAVGVQEAVLAIVGDAQDGLRDRVSVDNADQSTEVVDWDHLRKALDNQRVVEIRVQSAIGTGFDSAVRIRVEYEPEARIMIWMDGELFGIPFEMLDEQEVTSLLQQVKKAYDDFKRLVSLVRPLFAAITVDEAIPTIGELKDDPRTSAFGTSILSKRVINQIGRQALEAVLGDADREEWEDGEYFDFSGFHAGWAGGQGIDPSIQIAHLIAANVPGPAE